MNSYMNKQGFTLVELMIVIAIIAIIAVVAVPSYQESLKTSRHGDAKAALLIIQVAQEKYRANNPSYGTLAQISGSSTSSDGFYTIAVLTGGNAPTATSFIATATPAGAQVGDSCGTYAINASGELYTGYASQDCWNQ